jgi:hypothetical protein
MLGDSRHQEFQPNPGHDGHNFDVSDCASVAKARTQKDYLDIDGELRPLLEKINGFISIERNREPL